MSKPQISAQDILKYIAAYDSDGQSSTEIDTKQEFDMLGAYLNGNQNLYNLQEGGFGISESINLDEKETNVLLKTINGLKEKFGDWQYSFSKKNKITDENLSDYANRYYSLCEKLQNGELDKTSKKDLQNIEAKLKKYVESNGVPIEISTDKAYNLPYKFNCYKKELDIKKLLNNPNNAITKENAKQYLDYYKYIVDGYETPAALGMTKEEISEASNKLKQSLADYIGQNNKELSDKLTPDNIQEFDVLFIMGEIAKKHQKVDELIIPNGNIVKEQINNPYDNKNLAFAVENYIKDNNVQELSDIPENVDIGNGAFDKTSTQKTNNCWAHAGLNALLTTPEGRQLIESNYYRDEKTGVIAVHLKEAEDFGLHDGIFIVTPEEIASARETVSEGEGDITAYMVAIKKYFEEAKSTPEIQGNRIFKDYDEGNTSFRFFEIMTGAQYYKYDSLDNIDIQDGIGTSSSFDNNQLYDLVENQKGAVTISLRGVNHAISIVGVKDGKYLVQESNNDEHFFDGHIGENKERLFLPAESVNGRPTFSIDKETLYNYNLGAISFIKWK